MTPRRKKWPFKRMEIGDEIIIRDQDELARSQMYAHVFARQKGWKFETETMDDEKGSMILRIKRIK